MSGPRGRVLAVDPGEVRVGLALSDPLGWTAQPLPTASAKATGGALARIVEIAREHDVREIVVGLPLSMSGEETEASRLARRLASRIEDALPDARVVLWDERMTSAEAERAMLADGLRARARRGRVDRVAAALILQSYLDASS